MVDNIIRSTSSALLKVKDGHSQVILSDYLREGETMVNYGLSNPGSGSPPPPVPTLTSIDPTSAPNNTDPVGVVLTGTNLDLVIKVDFVGPALVNIPIFTIDSSTQITAAFPAGTTEVDDGDGGTLVLSGNTFGVRVDAGNDVLVTLDNAFSYPA